VKWVETLSEHASHALAGSATPGLTIDELISLSSDADVTQRALSFRNVPLTLGGPTGGQALRSAIATLYQGEGHEITEENVITATGTTGANLNVLYSLLRADDHVICSYPIYNQLLNLPQAQGCEVSLWRLNKDDNWSLDIKELESLIRPNTKLLIVNNPNNPTGSHLDKQKQLEILDIASRRNIIVLVDEIFRPLFHGTSGPDVPPSFVKHDYKRVVVTGSMSKAWGLTGTRIGWIVSRDQSLLENFTNTRNYTSEATSTIDELIATEALSDRCRPTILQRHLSFAEENLSSLDKFIAKNKDICKWTRPTAAATAFIQFLSKTGEPVDDVQFCRSLLDTKGVLLSPGSLCFTDSLRQDQSFKGFVRIHFTLPPATLTKSLELIDEFLEQFR
jgi:aspartate/methionine/tyrosine aminotransferase